jgi:DNA-binding GntR family transcriptional regulator
VIDMVLVGEPEGALRAGYPEPLWVQAVEAISRQVAEGNIRPGGRLPPERELCLQLGISRVTLRKALTSLVQDGVLQPSHGRGWHVAAAAPETAAGKEWPNSLEGFSETAARMGLVATSRVLRNAILPASLDQAEELQIAPGAPLFHLERVRLLSDVPIALDLTLLPGSVVARFESADFEVDSLYDLITGAGLVMSGADSTIEAREADSYVASQLEIEVGKPILVMHQVVVDPSARPLFTSSIRYSGDRYRLRTFFARATPRNP